MRSFSTRVLAFILMILVSSTHLSCTTEGLESSSPDVSDLDAELDSEIAESTSVDQNSEIVLDDQVVNDQSAMTDDELSLESELDAIEGTADAEVSFEDDALFQNSGDSASLDREFEQQNKAQTQFLDKPTEIVETGNVNATEAVSVTGLDYKTNDFGGTIIVSTSGPASYTTRANPDGQQFIIEVQNAQLPNRFKRPYNTKEFPGPITGFQGYQKLGGNVARIVVQMRQPIEPVVSQVGSQIFISPTEEGAPTTIAQASQMMRADTSSESSTDPMATKGLDDFLLGKTKFYGHKISIQFKDAEVRDVINFISEESGMNILLSDDVTGKMSLKLRQVPWDQALVVIMKARGLGYVRQGNILRIAPLKTLQAEADQARSVIESQSKLRPLRVKVFNVSYAKAKDLEAQVKDLLSSERARVKSDERTNSLIVTDLEENLEKVTKLISLLDTQTPQVLIEARIVEARTEFQRRIGFQWDLLNGQYFLGNADDGPVVVRPNLSTFTDPEAVFGNFGMSITGMQYVGDLSASLKLYENENIVKVLSSPRVVTLNGIKANIEQTTQIPVPSITVTGTTPINTITYKDVSLKLEVTPQITADGGIIMELGVLREFVGVGVGDSVPVNKRSAKTTLLVQNGQTSVVGGIYQSDVQDGEAGVPLLRKIPILGNLFKQKRYSKDKSELLIFITPRILNKEKAFGVANSGSNTNG